MNSVATTICTLGFGLVMVPVYAYPQGGAAEPSKSSYLSVNEVDFRIVIARMSAARTDLMKRQAELLGLRYDLADHAASGATMSRGKPVQEGVRVRLPSGLTWDALAAMAPAEIREKGLYPAGFMPLPHPNHPEGGMVFPSFMIDEVKK